MALKKAANSGLHPAAPGDRTSPEAAIIDSAAAERVVVVREQPAAAVVPIRQAPPAPKSAPAPVAVVRAPKPASAAPRVGSPTKEPKRGRVSRRNKQDVVFLWARQDLEEIQRIYRDVRGTYRREKKASDPSGKYQLLISALTAEALRRGLATPGEWAASVRNDARRVPNPEGHAQIGLVWPVELADQLLEAWEDMEASDMWPDDFFLTKANLAAAGILHALRSVDEWLLEVPNDDRHSVPTAEDGRHNPRRGVVPTQVD